MKKIKIFLASSITDLKIDRLEVGDFIRQLNDIYFDRGVQFFLGKCDDYDNAIAADGKQSEFDREIRESELCFFLFFKKVGDYTRHEFEVALDAFKTCNKPKIVTYFKYVETPDEAQGEVKAFMQMLDGEIKHYYNIYQSIDTLKLGILMQIKLMGLDAEEPKVENGKVTFGGQTIADTAALPVFTGNTSLAELKEKHKSLTQRYYELREKLSSDLDDEAAEEEYRTVASERAETEKKLREAEKGVLEAMKTMAEHTAKGDLSPRQIAAYRAFEKGNYQGALEILDFNEIMEDLSHNEQMAEGYKERIQTNVNELLQRIEVMKADGIDKDEAVEIAAIYETVEERIEKHNLGKEPLYDYARFLYGQNNFEKAAKVANLFLYYCSDPRSPAGDDTMTQIWNLLGTLYISTRQHKKAEEACLKAIECGKRWTEKDCGDAGIPESRLAVAYGNYGGLCLVLQRFPEAERAYHASIEILRGILEKDPDAYRPIFAKYMMDYGLFCQTLQRYAEAENAYLKALDCYTLLAKKDPAEYEAGLAATYDNLSLLYSATQRYIETKDATEKAAEIYGRLAERNPDAYEPFLAKNKYVAADLYQDLQMYPEALEAAESACAIYRRLAKKDPAAFEMPFSVALRIAGSVYAMFGRFEEARAASENGIEIMERYNAEGGEYMLSHLAESYADLGTLDYQMEDYAEAEQMFTKAAAVFERLAKETPAVYASSLALCYNNLGLVYGDTDRPQESLDMAKKALDLYVRLAEQNPEVYEPDVAMGNYNYGLSCAETDPAEAERCYAEAYRIARKYPQNETCAEIVEILRSHFEGGS